jgi:hypothetical protein
VGAVANGEVEMIVVGRRLWYAFGHRCLRGCL